MSGDGAGDETPDTTFIMGQEFTGRLVAGTPPRFGEPGYDEAAWRREYVGTFATPEPPRTVTYNITGAMLDPDTREAMARSVARALATPRGARITGIRGDTMMIETDPPRALDPSDPRATHGPAWSAGTPHTDEEAAVMLGATEPRHALRDRMHHRMQRTLGNVVLEPSPRVTPGEPMPAATMPREDWREAWRDAEVPPLCTLVPRCEASGARVVLPMDYSLSPPESVRVRYASRDATLGSVLWSVRAARSGSTLDDLCRVGERADGAEHVPADAEGADDAQRERDARRMYPVRGARGWCEGLGAAGFDSAFVAPVVAEITWQAMRAACPERVYPEPTGGESE